MAFDLNEINSELPNGSPSQHIASQQNKIADIIMKTAAIMDTDQETDKGVE